jgi:hypothetical protein
MAPVRRQLPPAVPVQQVVHRRQGQRPAQFGLHLRPDLADHQDAAAAGALQKRRQQFALALRRHVLPAPATAALALAVTDNLAGQEAVAQPAGPLRRAADGGRRLLHAQAKVQRQHHRLRLPQLLDRLGARHHLARHLQYLRAPRRPRHVHLLPSVET